jgi:hypothetical protein
MINSGVETTWQTTFDLLGEMAKFSSHTFVLLDEYFEGHDDYFQHFIRKCIKYMYKANISQIC